MPARVEIDDARWPRVYVRWPSSALSDDEFQRVVLQLSAYTRRGQPYATIVDARHATRPTPLQRSFAAERQRLDAEHSQRWLRGSAIIVSNPLLVGVVTAINWVFAPPYPQKIFASSFAAEAWVDEQLSPGRGDSPERPAPPPK
jgi:hypothetical protein